MVTEFSTFLTQETIIGWTLPTYDLTLERISMSPIALTQQIWPAQTAALGVICDCRGKFFVPQHWQVSQMPTVLNWHQIKSARLLFPSNYQGWASFLFKRTFQSFPFFIKERNDLCVLFQLYKRTFQSLRSFPFFIKECSDLCILFRSL